MKKSKNIIFLLALATPLISNSVIANPDSLPANGEDILAAGKIKEVCFAAKPPSQINYQFSANKALDFNIHFHKEYEASYPIKQKDILSAHGIFTPDSEQFYCLMWTNKNKQAVKLKYNAKMK